MLRSHLLSGNSRLQSCLVSDPAHVAPGETGVHVGLIQDALMLIDDLPVSSDEISTMRYGATTANAVLAYKRKRNIVNPSYQTSPDDIVGKLTIESLDGAMAAKESGFVLKGGAAAPFLRGFFFAPKIEVAKTRLVILTETAPTWKLWALQIKKRSKLFLKSPDKDDLVHVIDMNDGESVATAASKLRRAASEAGPLGLLILSVGHGGVGDDNGVGEEGIADLAPNHTFQLGGRHAWMVGQAPPKDLKKIDPRNRPFPSATSAFYADRPPSSAGITILSDLENDRNNGSNKAKLRISNWTQYESVCQSFANLGLIVLLTCNVGRAQGFVRKMRQQFKTPILAYKRRIVSLIQPSGRARLFLEGDRPGAGTNTADGEIMLPLSVPDMTLIL